MDARIAAYVAARLLALYLLLGNGLTTAAVVVVGLFGGASEYRGLTTLAGAIGTLIYLGAGAAVWASSRWISDRVAGSLKTVELKDSGPDRWKALSVAVAGGLSLMAGLKTIAQPALWAKVMMGMITLWPSDGAALDGFMPQQTSLLPILLETIFFLAFGVILIACQNSIVRGINAVGTWAGKPIIDERES